jgi:hypothetical protein
MDLKNISLKHLALYISDYMRKNGIDCVLTGGACVAIHTDQKYISYDLDFVPLTYQRRSRIREILEKTGFREKGRHFTHKDTPFFIEFIAPPLAIGEEPISEIAMIEERGMVLKLLSPTDCTKDRLAAYYHWNDEPSLEQAILVCRNASVDVKEIERWSKKEGMEKKFVIFKRRLRTGIGHSRSTAESHEP